MGNAMNIETPYNRCIKLDELASGDVEITICSREPVSTDGKNYSKDWYPLAKTLVTRNRIQLIIEFLERLK